ncbi:MAG: type I glyceraldehyde-3-phosphate dehydrogenase [Planctomycetes bacterium]|nr:type I glyceraldehyde-3-phosphate dehydrogenase [Planctomycetota bacterium]
MAIRVAINGFGRIGRNVFKVLSQRDGIDVVAINDLADNEMLAHLLKYDTVTHRFFGDTTVKATDEAIQVGDQTIQVLSEREPANLPWGDLGIDVTVESTGIFRSREQVEWHLQAGAGKVVLTVPPKTELDNMVVLGVNDDTITPEQKMLSNASCTTNCLAPIAKILNDSFGIDHGIMTTVHAYTNDQHVADLPHSDPRRARAAAQNIIPTTTGAARAVGKVLPALDGKLDGLSLRVPVVNGSIVDLVVELEKDTTVEEINAAVRAAADGPMNGIVEYTEDPIVSSDIIMNPHSAIFDSKATMVLGGGGRSAKVLAWYDNEWGYSNRVCDLIERITSMETGKVKAS